MTKGVGNEPRDSLKGNHRGWFVGVIPSLLAETSKNIAGTIAGVFAKEVRDRLLNGTTDMSLLISLSLFVLGSYLEPSTSSWDVSSPRFSNQRTNAHMALFAFLFGGAAPLFKFTDVADGCIACRFSRAA